MVLFNAATKELTVKVVYYGPSLGGKTTNLKCIHGILSNVGSGKMLSIATQTDRTIFFDFLPIDFGTIRGMKIRIQLYTVPGQVFYDATRKLVLRGADAVVFVADSQASVLDANKESFQNLIDNLAEQGIDLNKMPHVIQWNKRDIPSALSVDVLNMEINRFSAPTFEACATQNQGVQETLQGILTLVKQHLLDRYGDLPIGDIRASLPRLQEPASNWPGQETPVAITGKLSKSNPNVKYLGDSNAIEVPVVLDRSLLSGAGPIEIKLKIFLK